METEAERQASDIDVTEYMRHAEVLMALLIAEGALEFPMSPGGLFVASGIGDPALAGVTGMDTNAWPRDTSLVSENLLLRADEDQGDIEKVIRAGNAFLTILHRNEGRMNDAIADPGAPPLPSRVNAITLENDAEWRNQFDSVGYLMRLPSILALKGLLRLSRDDLAILDKTAGYLLAREFWQKPDQGVWEEDDQIHNSSRGVAISGLVKAARAFDAHHHRPKVDMLTLAGRGREAFNASIWQYGETPPHGDYPGRFYDVSHMILTEGIRLFGDNFAASDILANRALKLMGEIASKRYFGDTYNATGFSELFALAERTTQGEGRQEKRDSLIAQTLLHGTEAQWLLPEGYGSSYWGRRGEWSHSINDFLLQYLYIKRNIGGYVWTERGLLGPELYHQPQLGGPWVPGDHIPLLWTGATTVGAVLQLERTGPAIADYLAR